MMTKNINQTRCARSTKKGQFDFSRKTIFWAIAMFVIIAVILVYLYIIGTYESQLTYVPPKLKAEFISLRFVNIGECFAYQDKETGRIYPGVLDLEKFTKEQLYSCYHTEKEKGYEDYNFRLKLASRNETILTNNYFHQDDFTLFRKVLVKDRGNLTADLLYVFVQVKI